MQRRLIAKVFVDKTVYSIDKAFDYLVPVQLSDTLKRGCRVLVPFGNSNKKIQGMVESIFDDRQEDNRIKPIFSQLDKNSVFTEEMFRMAEFLVKNTFCTYYEAIKTILPAGSNVDVIESYKLSSQLTQIEIIKFTIEEQRLIEFLRTAKTSKELGDFLDCSSNPSKKAVVKSLIEKGIIQKNDIVCSKLKKKTVKMVRLADGFEPSMVKLSPKQKEAVGVLSDVGVAMVKELCYLCGMTQAVIKNMAQKRMITYFDREVEILYEHPKHNISFPLKMELSNSQTDVYNGLLKLVKEDKANVALLYGVTGSGKTQVYIKLIEQVIETGKSAIMLVPEIALTPQLVEKFKDLFGDIVAVTHSNLSLSERMDEFGRIKAGGIKIVIGTRSAVFAPLDNIGIIILDEEGEASYKSDKAPRYHAREVAKLRCVNHNATLLLGSATPSIESYYNAQIGRYSLFSIEDRFSTADLPSVYIIDMLNEQKDNISPLSEVLQQQIRLNLEQNEQSILLINRRGYNTYATCMNCGEVIKCKSCDVAMTYHRVNGYLMCHYCGHTEKFKSKCPFCDGEYIKLTGVGTQKLEEEIARIFPTARILRMDTDTTYSRYSYEKSFNDFKLGKYDIMLGTQMIAKGLDFPNVTLVGVINADSGLYSADYKSSERIFSLITQVVGRSGRSEKMGRAYIQTMNPQNPIINFAAQQDYKSFYKDELETRRLLTYPPFCDICVLGFSSANEEAAKKAANRAVDILKYEAQNVQDIALKVLGVTTAGVYKVSNKYRYRIIIKCKFNNKFKAFLSTVIKKCSEDKLMRNITVFADINGDINS